MNFKVPHAIVWSAPLGVILGGLVGYFWPEVGGSAAFFFTGELFLGGLRFLVIPLVVASVITGMSALRGTHRAGKALGIAVGYFAATTAIAVVLALIVSVLLTPGRAAAHLVSTIDPQITALQNTGATELVQTVLQTLFPLDLATATRGQHLGFVALAMLFGMVLATMGIRQRSVIDMFRGINEALLRLFRLLIWAAPVGLLAVTASAVARGSATWETASLMASYLAAFGLVAAIHIAVVLPLVLHFFGRKNILEYYQNLWPAISTALASGSSAASLPVTYSCVVDRNAISHRAASMTLPLGSCLHANGAAIIVTVGLVFAAQAAGQSMSVVQYLLIILLAVGASFVTSGVPALTAMVTVMIAAAAGFPVGAVAALGLLLPLQWLTGRGSALVSVLSDSVGAAVVAEQLGERVDSRERREERPEPRYQSRSDRPPRDGDRTRSRSAERPSGDRSGQRPGFDPDRRRRGGEDRPSSGRPDRPDRGGRESSDAHRSRGEQSRPPIVTQERPRMGRGRGDQDRRGKSPFEIAPEAPSALSLESPAVPHVSSGVEAKETEDRKSSQPPAPIRYGRRGPSGRDRRERRQEPPKPPVATSAGKEDDDLTDQTIARERARVSAQLAALKQTEELSRAASRAAARITESAVFQDETEKSSEPSAPESEQGPQIDYVTRADEPPTPERTVARPEQVSASETTPATHDIAGNDEPSADSAADSEVEREGEAAEFGRSRRSRRLPPAANGESTGPADGSVAVMDQDATGEFRVEGQSFGRSRKKRTR